MADTLISALGAIPALADADIIPLTDATDTTTKRTTLGDIGDHVVDTARVTAAGALMDSEVDADIKTLSLPASTTISTYGASLIDDADAATARATLGFGSIPAQDSSIATITGTTDTLAAGDNGYTNLYTAAGAVTVTLANIATGFEAVLVSLGAGGLSVAAGGMSFANSFTPNLTVAQGEALYVKQTAASTWIVLGGTAA